MSRPGAAVLILVAVSLLAACSTQPQAVPVAPVSTRTVTIGGAGDGKTITFTCGPDAGTTCTEQITAANTDSAGSWVRQVALPVGATARATVRGAGPKSCRIADASDGITYIKQVPDLTTADAVCEYRVE